MACELYLKVVTAWKKEEKAFQKDNKKIRDKKDLRQDQLSKPNI